MSTQSALNVTTQAYRNIDIKLEVLDYTFYIIDEISGLVTDASFSIDADSDIRRTCSINMILKDDYSDNPLYAHEYWSSGNPFWFDKYLRISLGILDIMTGEYAWVNQGIYLINQPSITYDASSNTLNFEAVDLMCQLTGLRNGNLDGVTHLIEQGATITSAIKDTIEQFGFYKHMIVTPPQATVPYEIKMDNCGTAYELLAELRDINPNWEMFFDVNGTFYFREIPASEINTGLVQPYVSNQTLQQLVKNYKLDTSFEDVKNYIEVYGATKTTNMSSTNDSSTATDTLTITLGQDISQSSFANGYVADTLVTVGNIDEAIALRATPITSIIVKNSDNTTIGTIDISNIPMVYNNYNYCVRVIKHIDSGTSAITYDLSYLGYVQSFGLAWEDNPASPFYVGQLTSGSSSVHSGTDAQWVENYKPKFKKQIRDIKCGGEYDNIYSNQLAIERAKYELYLSARRHDTITIDLIPIYWLDVNQIIEYKLPNESRLSYWLVKDISTDFDVDGSQTITAIRLLNINE